MKHRYKTLSRVVSLLLTTAILMTTPTFSVFAEEIAENVQAADAIAADAEAIVPRVLAEEGTDVPEDATKEDAPTDSEDAEFELLASEDSDMQELDRGVVQPFTLAIDNRESISLNTGAVNYAENICSLPGIGGEKFDLRVTYSSADAVLEYADYEWDRLLSVLAGMPIATPLVKQHTHNELRYNIGAGWSFGIPSINTDAHNHTLHLPGVGSYALSGSKILNYPLKDMTLKWTNSYHNGQFQSDLALTFLNGTVYYFNEEGLLLAMVDRYDTAVTFKYVQNGEGWYPSEITDADGRITTFSYTNIENGRLITITAPDKSQTILTTQTLKSENLDCILTNIRLADGENIAFAYQEEMGYFNFSGLKEDQPLHFQLLNRVDYDSGAAVCYEYTGKQTNPGDFTRLDVYQTVRRYTLKSSEPNETCSETLYSYTGYSGSGGIHSTTTTQKFPNGTQLYVYYKFNGKELLWEQETSFAGSYKQKKSIQYDNVFETPKEVKTTTFSADEKVYIECMERYEHDQYGQVTQHYPAKLKDKSTNFQNRYRTNCSYHLNGILSSNEYTQGSQRVKTVNTLTADKKSIAETATYVNNTLTALTTYTYNARGQVTAKTDCLDLAAKTGVTTVYTYDGANLATETITGLTDADGNPLPDLVTAYTYDTMGRLLTATDAAGRTTTNTYDVRGRLLTTTAPDGSVTAYTYDLAANDTTVSQPGREDIVVDFDSIGQKQAVYYPSGDLQREYYYDTAGRLVIEATGRGSSAANTVYYTYDPLDRLIEKRICDKDGVELYRETTAYDDALTETQALVTKTVLGEDGAPGTVAKTYINAYGETVREDVGGVVTDYAYDFVGNRACTTYTEDGRTVSASCTYDFRGNVLTETNALGNTRTITYDAIGRKIAESDFKGNATTYAYDAAGRLLISSAPLDGEARSVVKYTYDSAGNVTRQMQSAEAVGTETPAWRTVEYVYDDRNRVTDIAQVADETHKVWTHYAYNEAGDLTDIYTGLSLKWSLAVNPETYSHTRYVYNNRGKATSLADALGQTETYVYDALGYLIEATGRDGKVTRYTYTGLGKPLTEAIYASAAADAPAVQTVYTYYRNGLTRSVTADGSTVQYTYDTHGNVLTESDETATRTYTYDSRGRKSSYALTAGDTEISTAAYAYDDLNRLVSVTEGGVTTTYTYDANGNRASQTTGEVSVAYTYNDANLVTSLTNTLTNASGEAVVPSAFAYTYYADGNQHTKTETLLAGDPITTTYVYDGLGRLTAETKGEDSIAYTYDASGNRIGMNQNGTVTTYAYDANNRLLSETVGDTVTVYTYDANGNTLTAGDKTYTYNTRGQQSGYSNGTTAAAYAYNPSGLRNVKTVGGSTKYFVYNGMNIVYEYTESVADGVAYFYGLNRTHNSEGEIYLYNAHGDVVQLVKNNAVVASYTYDAFGNLTSQIGESDNPFLYCGEYYDAETQTYYLRARYYNPANGRFTQQDAWAYMDASDPLSLNLYAYCCNNPVMYVDLTGNWPTFAQIATAVAVVAVGAVLVAATIASAGTVGAVAGAAVTTYLGASATTAAAVTTAATVGTYAVAGGIAATYASDAGEILTGHNVVRDDLMGGNQQAYDVTRTVLNVAATGSTYIGDTYGSSYSHSPSSRSINVRIAGKGSTGRTEASCLNEQLAMEQVKADPLNGATNLSTLSKNPIVLKDSRWLSSDGWCKMQNVVELANGKRITIHFVYNPEKKLFDDFKFVD